MVGHPHPTSIRSLRSPPFTRVKLHTDERTIETQSSSRAQWTGSTLGMISYPGVVGHRRRKMEKGSEHGSTWNRRGIDVESTGNKRPTQEEKGSMMVMDWPLVFVLDAPFLMKSWL